jgi:hypothetical protein
MKEYYEARFVGHAPKEEEVPQWAYSKPDPKGSWLDQKKQKAIELLQRQYDEKARRDREAEEWLAAETVRANAELEADKKRVEDLNFLMNSPIPHFDPAATIDDLWNSDWVLEIGTMMVVEDCRPVRVPTLVAKEDGHMIHTIPLCERIQGTGREKAFGELHVPDIRPIEQRVIRHNALLQQRKSRQNAR